MDRTRSLATPSPKSSVSARDGGLFLRWISYDTRSGIYRESTEPHEEVPSDFRSTSRSLDARLQVSDRATERRRAATLKLYSLKPLGFIEIAQYVEKPRICDVTGELEIPLTAAVPATTARMYIAIEIEDSRRAHRRSRRRQRSGSRKPSALIDEERASDGDRSIRSSSARLL